MNMKLLGICELKKIVSFMLLLLGLLASCPVNANYYQEIRPENFRILNGVQVPASGTINNEVLAKAPSPDIVIQGTKRKAVIVVDLSKNVLYKYDKYGNPEIAYLVASGKQTTPTAEGVRIVSHVESYPYRTAPVNTKRHKAPYAFGPKIIILNMVDTYRGIKWNNGEYIHGNNNPESIGKYASHGCIRMDNSVITELSKKVSHGDIVVMKR